MGIPRKTTSLEKLKIQKEKERLKALKLKKHQVKEQLTEKEESVIYKFLNTGNRIGSYRDVFGNKPTDESIYQFFRRKSVIDKVVEAGNGLSIFDTVCDIKLLSIINDPDASHKNQINAIKEWNNLRNRVHTNIKVEQVQNIDFTDLSDEGLQKIVDALNPQVQEIEYEEINNENEERQPDETKDNDEYGF